MGSDRVLLNDLAQQVHVKVAVHLSVGSLANISFGIMHNVLFL